MTFRTFTSQPEFKTETTSSEFKTFHFRKQKMQSKIYHSWLIEESIQCLRWVQIKLCLTKYYKNYHFVMKQCEIDWAYMKQLVMRRYNQKSGKVKVRVQWGIRNCEIWLRHKRICLVFFFHFGVLEIMVKTGGLPECMHFYYGYYTYLRCKAIADWRWTWFCCTCLMLLIKKTTI